MGADAPGSARYGRPVAAPADATPVDERDEKVTRAIACMMISTDYCVSCSV